MPILLRTFIILALIALHFARVRNFERGALIGADPDQVRGRAWLVLIAELWAVGWGWEEQDDWRATMSAMLLPAGIVVGIFFGSDPPLAPLPMPAPVLAEAGAESGRATGPSGPTHAVVYQVEVRVSEGEGEDGHKEQGAVPAYPDAVVLEMPPASSKFQLK